MSEAQAAVEKKAKPVREEKAVTMSDGRVVTFVGKRKALKETLIDTSKIALDADNVTLSLGAVTVRMDFVNGQTRMWTPPLALVAKAIGHGIEQKLGDEYAGEEDVDDCVEAVDDLTKQLDKGEWTTQREGGGSHKGASVIVKAFLIAAEQRGKPTTVDKVKAFLQSKLDAAKAKGESLTRKALYDSFRVSEPFASIIKGLEEEKLKSKAPVDAGAALDELDAVA